MLWVLVVAVVVFAGVCAVAAWSFVSARRDAAEADGTRPSEGLRVPFHRRSGFLPHALERFGGDAAVRKGAGSSTAQSRNRWTRTGRLGNHP